MNEEEKIKQGLEERFGYLKGEVIIKRKGRIFAQLPLDKLQEVLDHTAKQMNFSAISAITGLDEKDAFAVMYHVNREGRVILTLKVRLDKANPAVKTVTPYFSSADIYEREIADLFGIKVDGLPPGSRYPLPDNWPANEYPLRKDWKGAATITGKEVQDA